MNMVLERLYFANSYPAFSIPLEISEMQTV